MKLVVFILSIMVLTGCYNQNPYDKTDLTLFEIEDAVKRCELFKLDVHFIVGHSGGVKKIWCEPKVDYLKQRHAYY